MSYIYQPDRDLLAKQIKKYAHHIRGIVLDVGSGGLKRYASLFKCEKYITLDIDEKCGSDIIASVEKIPMGDESVDAIICTQVLGDIKDIELAVREFYRVLKRGGVILLTESLFNELHDEPNDFWRFTSFSLKYILEENKFKIIEIDQRGGFFSSQAQLRIRYLIDRLGLYSKKRSFILGPLIMFYGKFMVFLDKIDRSKANRKHAIGWCVLARK